LEWFFCTYPYGPNLASLTRDGRPLALCQDGELRLSLERLDKLVRDEVAAIQEIREQHSSLSARTPVLPAVLADILLSHRKCELVPEVLRPAIEAFPDDLRLTQLLGLYWSRKGKLTRAREILEPLYSRYRDDEETAGILAGVYKRLWSVEDDQDWLTKSHRIYLKGWRGSKSSNPYLGINAATTALWLGNKEESIATATEIRQLLLDRMNALASFKGSHDLTLGYWDLVTLAEAELLLADSDQARKRYHEAFSRYPEEEANIQVSRDQANGILEALGRPNPIETFWNAESANA
jgi:tetratricopeptide (TPR) repeat protein